MLQLNYSTAGATKKGPWSILFEDAAKEVFLGLCMVFGTKMFRLLVQSGYETLGINRHLVGGTAKALDWEAVVLDAGAEQGQTRCTVFVHVLLECLKEKVALADEVVEGGEEGIQGTLWGEQGQEGERGTRSTRLCVLIDGLDGVQVAAGCSLEAETSLVEEGEAVCAPGKDVVVDGVVELPGVLYDGDEGVLDEVLSVAVVCCEWGAETVDDAGLVDDVVAVGESVECGTG